VKSFYHTRRVSTLSVSAAIICALFVTGCALKGDESPRLQLRSMRTKQVYAQQFDRAYYSSRGTGEYEIVLIDDSGGGGGSATDAKRKSAKSGEPLPPSQAAPLRQVVHIRVHWRPLRGTKPDHPSATNAVIDWYVTAPAGDATQTNDRLHYQGAAFVELGTTGTVAKVTITKAQMSLVEVVGSLHDPVGRSVLSGSFAATRNDAMLVAATTPLRLDAAAAAAAARTVRPARSVQSPRENLPGGGGGQ
jgi:hypothetical protein